MRQPEPGCHPCCDAHGPVGARRDDPVGSLCACETLDRLLVLGRDERPLVGEREPGCARVGVGSDHEQIAGPGRLEQAELSRAGA